MLKLYLSFVMGNNSWKETLKILISFCVGFINVTRAPCLIMIILSSSSPKWFIFKFCVIRIMVICASKNIYEHWLRSQKKLFSRTSSSHITLFSRGVLKDSFMTTKSSCFSHRLGEEILSGSKKESKLSVTF